MNRSWIALLMVGVVCLIGTAGAQAPKLSTLEVKTIKPEPVSAEVRCRIVLGALRNTDGSPFEDSKKDTLARHIAGVIGGSQGEQAVTGDLESQCKLALEIWRQTWTQHVVTREANIKARVAAENEKTKVAGELNFGESLLQPAQAKP